MGGRGVVTYVNRSASPSLNDDGDTHFLSL